MEVKNNVTRNTHISLPGTGLIVLFLVLFLFAVDGWAGCVSAGQYSCSSSNGGWCRWGSPENMGRCSSVGGGINGTGCQVITSFYCSGSVSSSGTNALYANCVYCDNQTSKDSLICLLNGNLWINNQCCDEQCVCENDGGRWENGQCNPACNDHVDVPDKCEEIFRNGYGMDGGYWAIQTYECYFDSCAMSLNCTEKSQFPAGNLTCDDFQDTTQTPGRCVGVVGHTCTMECPGNKTKTCDCDGSCSHAMTLPQCACQSSSSGQSQSSSSGESQSSSSGESQSSSSGESQSSSSGETPPTPGSSGAWGDWEYDYREVLDRIEKNTGSSVGYLSSIDKRITAQNMQIQESTNRIVSATESATASAVGAIGETKDTLHRTNEILEGIGSSLGTLDSSVDVPDISAWQTSADSLINKLQHPDTALVKVDSLNNDTSAFKTKYSSFFVHDVYTRNGCYEFVIKKPSQNSRFGRFFSSDISVDFGSIGGFDFCAILRGLCRIAGAVLVLLISIKSYRSAFSSEDG